jgi:hypothetical protein
LTLISDRREYNLASWDLVYVEKKYGGLGVHNLREFNLGEI